MKSQILRPTPFAGGAIAAAMLAFGAAAHDGELHLDDMIGEADLVFAGEVVDISYGLSQPSGPEGSRLPHTFVTYHIDSIMHGADPGRVLTLRFIGGLNAEKGRYMRATNAPQFDLGDRDILFVSGNGFELVPLVGADAGRLRMIDGVVYTEQGQSVRLGEDGELMKGARYQLEEVAVTNVEGREFFDDLGPKAVFGSSDAMPADDLLIEIAAIAEDLPKPKIEVAQADPRAPFEGPDMTPAAPPAPVQDGPAKSKIDDPREAQQRRALEEQASPLRRSIR